MAPPKRYCEVEGCSNPRFGHGYCNAHYKRWRKTGDPGSAEMRKKTEFCTVEGCLRKHTAKGLCHSHLNRYNRTGVWPTTPITPIAKWYRTDKCGRPYCDLPGNHQGYCPRHNARRKVFISYGMRGWEDFDEMWERCQGLCNICKIDLEIDSKNTHVDHCHDGVFPRGLLCESCNNLLGNARESADVLLSAIDYLKTHSRPFFDR